jgi:hypothetical protein
MSENGVEGKKLEPGRGPKRAAKTAIGVDTKEMAELMIGY